MTPQRAKELLAVFTAFAEGKAIEARPKALKDQPILGDGWYHVPTADFHDCNEYRIAPKRVSGWINVCIGKTSRYCLGPYDTNEAADRSAGNDRVACVRFEYERSW